MSAGDGPPMTPEQLRKLVSEATKEAAAQENDPDEKARVAREIDNAMNSKGKGRIA